MDSLGIFTLATKAAPGNYQAQRDSEMEAADGNLITLAQDAGLYGVAVDGAGNVYADQPYGDEIMEWTAANNNYGVLIAGPPFPTGVAVDGSGNVYIAAYQEDEEWTPSTTNLIPFFPSGTDFPCGVAVDSAENIYLSDPGGNTIYERPHAFMDPTPKLESLAAGIDTLPIVLPATVNLLPPFAPASDQPWLAINGVANGVVSFSFTANAGSARTANISLLGQIIPVTQGGPNYSLGASTLVEGPGAGIDSVVLGEGPEFVSWSATANAAWLHLGPGMQSGDNATNVVFSFDANPGMTRSGTLTIAGLTLTVTQAGSTYVAARPLVTLASSGLMNPRGVAIDGAGNVYIADNASNTIDEWKAASDTLTTVVSSGLSGPNGLAMDNAGNLYFADSGHNAIKELMAAGGSVTTLVSSGLNTPLGLAVDSLGNVYIANAGAGAIDEWVAANGNLTTLVSGLNSPNGVALDIAGNLYISDTGNGEIKELTRANHAVTTLVSGLSGPSGIAVDGRGNVYFTVGSTIEEWTAASNALTTLVSSGLNNPLGVGVDAAGNVYIGDSRNADVKELPRAFVDAADRLESLAAGRRCFASGFAGYGKSEWSLHSREPPTVAQY